MTIRKPILEVCIDTLEGGIQAARCGAHQLEVCSRLDLDGLTPASDFISELAAAVRIPLKVMIRPREGDFFYTQSDIETMCATILRFKSYRIDGFVTGALLTSEDGAVKVDVPAMIQLCKAAFPFHVTMHKAIDLCTDMLAEVRVLKEISNLSFILSSGGQPTALEGASMLSEMKKVASPSIEVIGAGRITSRNLPEIKEITGLTFFHGRRIVEP
jgi:copper homeostasis protein